MNYTRKNTIIQYGNKYVAGYSLKTGKVYYVPKQEDAQKFTPTQASLFIASHIGEKKGFLAHNITIILLDWRKKFSV